MSTVHGCPRSGVPDYKTAKFYLVQMPEPESNRITYERTYACTHIRIEGRTFVRMYGKQKNYMPPASFGGIKIQLMNSISTIRWIFFIWCSKIASFYNSLTSSAPQQYHFCNNKTIHTDIIIHADINISGWISEFGILWSDSGYVIPVRTLSLVSYFCRRQEKEREIVTQGSTD